MPDVLPDYSAPNISLQINGVVYQYTMNKNSDTDSVVIVGNENIEGDGYIWSSEDDWSGKPGATIRKFFSFPNSNAELWGPGSMQVDGDGSISNPSLVYNYKMDIGEEQISCANPINDPSCPGFIDALYKYLLDNGLIELDPNDPFYDEWVQAELEKEQLEAEEQQPETEEEKEQKSNFEKGFGVDGNVGQLVDAGEQALMLQELANTAVIDSYYTTTIPGGTYSDTVILQDSTLPDNTRALRNLALDVKHETMVRSQYDKEQ